VKTKDNVETLTRVERS